VPLTVLSVASRAVLDACARLGLDAEALLVAADLRREQVYDPDARLPADAADALWRHAYAAAGDPRLALHAAESLPFGAYKTIDFVAAHAPTVGEGLRRVARYFPLVDARAHLEIVEGDATSPVSVEMQSPLGSVAPPAQEYTLAALVLRSRASAGVAWALAAVEFTFPRPAEAAEHERIFACPVRFGQARTRLEIPRASWSLPVRGADPALSSVLEDHAQRLVAELPTEDGALLTRLRAVLREELRGGDASIGHVARRLALGERTLQRRLEELGVGFVDVLAEIRGELAREYLREPGMSLAEVAWLLGFSDQSAFTRAFKRWTGVTPGAWRGARGAVQ
jgi:AraC-like DNA-binding protein